MTSAAVPSAEWRAGFGLLPVLVTRLLLGVSCLCEVMSLLSVMSVAMHLSGLGAEHFTQDSGSKVKWLYEEAKILQQQQQTTQGSQSPALSSASSSTESSGFNSWPGSDHSPPAGDDIVADNFNLVTPNVEKIMYSGRNILDLGSHVRDATNWNLRYSLLPRDVQNFFNNRSQYSRANGDQTPLHVDVPCENCGFVESFY